MTEKEYKRNLLELTDLFDEGEALEKLSGVLAYMNANYQRLKNENLAYNQAIQKMHEELAFKSSKLIRRERQLSFAIKIGRSLLEFAKKIFKIFNKREVDAHVITGKKTVLVGNRKLPVDYKIKVHDGHTRSVARWLYKMEQFVKRNNYME